MTDALIPVRMPKWGLSMQEGVVIDWLKHHGDRVAEGEDLFEVETSKITNVAASPAAGVLRRIVGQAGDTLPVGALLAVLAEPDVTDAEIDAYVTDFQSSFVAEAPDEAAAGEALQLELIEIGGGRALRIGRAGKGDGVPAVLIHGFAGDLNGWLFNLETLVARGPVIAVDLPGHGGSTKDVDDGSLDALARDVGAALDALGVTRARLIGHSLGAAVAVRLAQMRPGLAQALVLIAPAYMPGGALDRAFLDGVVEARRARDLKPVLEKLVADPSLISREMVEDVIKFKRLDGAAEAMGRLRDRMVSGADLTVLDLASVGPAHVIASKADAIVGVPDVAALPQDWRVSWIGGAGHLPHLEKSAEVNALLAESL
jgi:pyruvate dehydrogenase E2 component (dihydrolipoamide acetyltransferase)